MAGPSEYDARRIGAAARFDLQLQVPARPRQRRGLVPEPIDGAVVVSGVPRRQTFKGAFASTSLLPLLELATGEHTHEQIAQSLQIDEKHVFDALALLWKSGIVEDAPSSARPVPEVAPALATQLSRLGDTTAANASWEVAADRLLTVDLQVLGQGPFADALRDLLAEGGMTPAGTEPNAAQESLVVLALDEGVELPSAEVEAAWLSGKPMLRVRLSGSSVRVGPYVRRGSSACLACLTAGEDPGEPEGRAPEDLAVTREIAVALAARQVHALVSRALPSHLPQHTRQTDTETLEMTQYTGATRPGCPSCSVRVLERPRPAPPGAQYEASVAMPRREFADLKGHQNHYKPSNQALQKSFRTWPSCPRVPLPHADLDRLAVPWGGRSSRGGGQLAVDDLSVLLKIALGLQDEGEERVYRWTAAGGNIGSAQGYLLVRDCPGLEPGLYAYVEKDHRLARLAGSVGTAGGESPVTVVMTGSVAKVAQKYGPFALRIALLDGGCALTSLVVAGDALGVAVRTRDDWDGAALSSLLQLVPETEVITSVTDIARLS